MCELQQPARAKRTAAEVKIMKNFWHFDVAVSVILVLSVTETCFRGTPCGWRWRALKKKKSLLGENLASCYLTNKFSPKHTDSFIIVITFKVSVLLHLTRSYSGRGGGRQHRRQEPNQTPVKVFYFYFLVYLCIIIISIIIVIWCHWCGGQIERRDAIVQFSHDLECMTAKVSVQF